MEEKNLKEKLPPEILWPSSAGAECVSIYAPLHRGSGLVNRPKCLMLWVGMNKCVCVLINFGTSLHRSLLLPSSANRAAVYLQRTAALLTILQVREASIRSSSVDLVNKSHITGNMHTYTFNRRKWRVIRGKKAAAASIPEQGLIYSSSSIPSIHSPFLVVWLKGPANC